MTDNTKLVLCAVLAAVIAITAQLLGVPLGTPPPADAAIVKGTSGPDLRFGTIYADEMFLYAGNDEAHGRSGDDYMSGGDGADKMWGGQGRDFLLGGNGNDRLYAGCMPNPPAHYGITACPNNPGQRNELHGGPGNDVLGADNGVYDYLYCETGTADVAFADKDDYVHTSCETVYRDGVRVG